MPMPARRRPSKGQAARAAEDVKVASEFWAQLSACERFELLQFTEPVLVSRIVGVQQNLRRLELTCFQFGVQRRGEAGEPVVQLGLDWLEFDIKKDLSYSEDIFRHEFHVASISVSRSFAGRPDLPAVLEQRLGGSLVAPGPPLTRPVEWASLFEPEPNTWAAFEQMALRLLATAIVTAARDAKSKAEAETSSASAQDNEDVFLLDLETSAGETPSKKKKNNKKKGKKAKGSNSPGARVELMFDDEEADDHVHEADKARTTSPDELYEEVNDDAKEALSPSLGSKLHGHLSEDSQPLCQPCAWFYKASGCMNGATCRYCHLCPPGELKNRKKHKIALLRGQDGRRPSVGDSLSPSSCSDGSPQSGRSDGWAEGGRPICQEKASKFSDIISPARGRGLKSGGVPPLSPFSITPSSTAAPGSCVAEGVSPMGSAGSSPRTAESSTMDVESPLVEEALLLAARAVQSEWFAGRLPELPGVKAAVKRTFLHFEAVPQQVERLRSRSCSA